MQLCETGGPIFGLTLSLLLCSDIGQEEKERKLRQSYCLHTFFFPHNWSCFVRFGFGPKAPEERLFESTTQKPPFGYLVFWWQCCHVQIHYLVTIHTLYDFVLYLSISQSVSLSIQYLTYILRLICIRASVNASFVPIGISIDDIALCLRSILHSPWS